MQRIIQQAQQQAQQETQEEERQYVGCVVNSAEQTHVNKLSEKSKTEQAEKRTKKTETSEHNTDHKNERTPDNRAKAKQRAGASPKKSPGKLQPFPTGEPASGSQDQPKHDNPESKHEPKRKPGRPSNTKQTNQGPPIKTDSPNKPTAKAKANPINPIPKPNPKHDTHLTNSNDFKFWKDQDLGK